MLQGGSNLWRASVTPRNDDQSATRPQHLPGTIGRMNDSNARAELPAATWGANAASYQGPEESKAVDSATPSRRLGLHRWIGGNVLFLGLTSFFTDVSAELVTTILPIYLVFQLRLSPLEFGIIDGIYHGASAPVRLASGLLADRWQRYKEIALCGYALSALCKIGLLLAGGVWIPLAAVLFLDRVGKGIRSSPRDALISLSVPRPDLGAAFGFHRALDTFGALLGPLIAFVLLMALPNAFGPFFLVSFFIALLGVGTLALFVENRQGIARQLSPVSVRGALSLLGIARFRTLVLIGTGLSLATMSDGFLYLVMQRQWSLQLGFFPLLFFGTAVCYTALAVPFGRLADRLGRLRVFVSGYSLLLGVYALLLIPPAGSGYLALAASLILLGSYYAATDGVLMAAASAVLPPDRRTSGLALIATGTSLARLVASIVFGVIWTWVGPTPAVAAFLVTLSLGLATTLAALARNQGLVNDAQV